MGAISSFPNIY